MGRVTRQRKILIALGLVLAAFILLIATFPFWLPWVLQPALKNYGAQYSRYERASYDRFILHDLVFSSGEVTFKAKQTELFSPTTLLFRHWRNVTNENFLRVADWDLELKKSVHPEKRSKTTFHSSFKKIEPHLAQLNGWLPRASLTNGHIHFDGKEILIPVAQWNNGVLNSEIAAAKILPATIFSAHLNGPTKQLFFKTVAWNLSGGLNAREKDNALLLDGDLTWLSNRVELAAEFGDEEFLPTTASVISKNFRFPAHLLKLEGYNDLSGALDLHWRTNHFALDLAAKAQPLESREIFLSPIDIILHAKGDTNAVRLESADISSSWLQVKLSQNAEFNFRGEMLSPTAELKLAADLSRQKWVPATGQLSGSAILQRGENRFPDMVFDLSGTNVAVSGIETGQLNLRGQYEWPWLRIQSAQVHFREGGSAEASLRFNAVQRLVSDGRLKLDGQIGHSFLPPDISYQNISLAAEFSGALKHLSHSAHLEVDTLRLPKLAPQKVVADWRGKHLDLESFEAKTISKNSQLLLAGSVQAGTNGLSAQVEKLELNTNATPLLKLEKPFALSLAKTAGEKPRWSFLVSPFVWRGEKTKISLGADVSWPERGNIRAALQEFDPSISRDFLEEFPPRALVEKLNLSASWTNSAVEFSLETAGRFTLEDGRFFNAKIRGGGNQTGVSIGQFDVGEGSETVLSGKGTLPLILVPASPTNFLQTLPDQRIDFHASTRPDLHFWEQISSLTHTKLKNPSAQIAIAGTLNSPKGKISLSADEIIWASQKTNQPLPRFQNFKADFDLVRDRIALHRFELLIAQQPVSATGELPLPRNFGTNWQEIFDWRKADVNLKIVDAQVAAFARLFPNVLTPIGTVNLDVSARGGKLDGQLTLAGAALRPISNVGAVHDIQARLKLSGEQIRVETFKGFIGGQPVELLGEINFAKLENATQLPIFNFKLRGTNVPLARQPEFILRSDLAIEISNDKGGEPLISGRLNLHDSFFLSDLKLLVPGKVSKPKQRPPYFSVEAEPFSKWRLAVVVQGANSFKVRSPLFRGELSTNLRIEGTLKEPFALGDARITSGTVLLPFANFRVQQGFVSLTSDNPYRPQLALNAGSRAFGYELKMDASGPVDKPNVEFSSTPGLTSEQILLMVTAGELPHDEISFSTQQRAGTLAYFLGKN
ncbi:MAG: translocation/assembly module TamB domain-containing protein, partial [Verrucomicrobiota bacterium]